MTSVSFETRCSHAFPQGESHCNDRIIYLPNVKFSMVVMLARYELIFNGSNQCPPNLAQILGTVHRLTRFVIR